MDEFALIDRGKQRGHPSALAPVPAMFGVPLASPESAGPAGVSVADLGKLVHGGIVGGLARPCDHDQIWPS
jgi:hypothetical protein